MLYKYLYYLSKYYGTTIIVPTSYDIDYITYVLSVYYIYDFAYSDYMKLCSKCHNKLYKFFRKDIKSKSKIVIL